MNQRRSDDPGQIRVTREIPLWGLLSVMGVIACQAILLWAGQREQSMSLVALTARFTASDERIQQVANALSSQNVKNAEHDWQIRDLDRRLQAIENAAGAAPRSRP